MVASMGVEKAWPVVRDVLAFAVGAYGVITELGNTPKDPVTLAFCAGLMGVPAMLGVTKKNGASK